MRNFFKSLSHDVLFVTFVALVVIGFHLGFREYRTARQSGITTECARQVLELMGRETGGSNADYRFIYDFCVRAGGKAAFYQAANLGKRAKHNSSAQESGS